VYGPLSFAARAQNVVVRRLTYGEHSFLHLLYLVHVDHLVNICFLISSVFCPCLYYVRYHSRTVPSFVPRLAWEHGKFAGSAVNSAGSTMKVRSEYCLSLAEHRLRNQSMLVYIAYACAGNAATFHGLRTPDSMGVCP